MLSCILLFMIVYACAAFLVKNSSENTISLVLLFSLGISIFAVAILRFSNGLSSSGDFRYIYPILYSMVYFFVRGFSDFANNNLLRLKYLGCLAGSLFCLLSILLYLSIFGFIQ